MNTLVESLNLWGARFLDFAPAILWQSSLLMALIFIFDFALRRKIRPAVRYTLWFVVFIKLVVPPTLALPTGAAWWLRGREVTPPHARAMTVSYSEPEARIVDPLPAVVPLPAPKPALTREAWVLVGSVMVSILLFAWAIFRWLQIARCVRKTTVPPDDILEMLEDASHQARVRNGITLRLTSEAMSPAVCGMFRPVILLPQSLIGGLPAKQLRAVLLHELIHLRRYDVWVNCAQTLLQIVYWWHPLLWFANARVRRLREESVDDAVMVALNDDAEIYAPTLLEVAKLAFNRPLAALGLVGILESRNALRHRIERLLNFTTPGRAGLSVVSVICIAAFTALAVPMGEPPARSADTADGSEPMIKFHEQVNPDVFIRNLKARAGETMHTTNDDWNEILVSILDGFGVDCTGPRKITLNTATGEIITQNSSEALGIVDEVVRELNLSGGERILNPPHPLAKVLIEAEIYLLHPADFSKLNFNLENSHHQDALSPWWSLTSDQMNGFRQRIKNFELESRTGPSIQTAHGIAADLRMGDGTNTMELECVPYVHDGSVNLTVLARTTGKYAPGAKGWPDIAGHTNCAIFSRMGLPDGSGALLRAEHAGVDNDLIILLKTKIVKPQPPASVARVVSTVSASASNTINTNIDQQLRTAPQEVTVKVRFVEVETNFAGALGLDSYLGPPDHEHPWPSIATLNDPKFRKILKALEQRNGATLLSESVTTLSGREAQLQMTDVTTNANKDVIEKRATIDLMPTVAADGEHIQMNLNPTEWLTLLPGSPSSPVWPESSNSAPVMTLSRALPPGRGFSTLTNVVAGDGQTIVLANFHEWFSFRTPEGDSKTMDFFETRKKRLLVFVTPTIIDGSGNRIHSEDYYDGPTL